MHIHIPLPPLDPLLASVNTLVSGGIQRRNKLWFYAPNLGYVVCIRKHKYRVIRVTNMVPPHGPEPIPLLQGGDLAEVVAILKQEPFFLSPEDVSKQWKQEEDWEQWINPFTY